MATVVAVVLLVSAATAEANTGIPMVIVTGFWLVVAFPLVVLVETVTLSLLLRQPISDLGPPVTVANLVSTLVGYPVAWLLLMAWQFGASMVLYEWSPRIDVHNFDQLGPLLLMTAATPAWVAPFYAPEAVAMLATVVNLGVAFAASIWIEGRLLRRRLEVQAPELRGPLVRAHVLSYSMLLLIAELGWIADS